MAISTSPNARNYQSQNSRSQFLTPLRLAWFLFALLLVAPPRVGAENRAGAFTLTPYFGGQGFPFGGDTHYDADYNYGLRAGYNFTPHWGTEFVFGLNRTVHDPEAEYCNIYQY